ncbi:MAG: 50S ribosomal protein L18 [Phycisphaerales bacterium]|jgi:large subunit ribosomal protein L18
MKTEQHKKAAIRRRRHVRKKVSGTPDRPRLSVFRSNRNIYAQLIDDTVGVTLVAASTQVKGVREAMPKGGNKKAAEAVGEQLAKKALDVGIKNVCFDRGPYRYHGRVKALADAARKAGLAF